MCYGIEPPGCPIRPDAPAHAYRMQRWYAYMAALFEYERARIDGRIHEAEMAILSRQRELIPGDAERME